MKPKIVEILTKILGNLETDLSLEDVNKKLHSSNEYDTHTLGVAFSLLYDKILLRKSKQKGKGKKKNKSFRFFTDEEKEILGKDNFGYIMHLVNVGLIDSKQLEDILNQINLFPDNMLTRREINWMVLLSLVDIDSDIPPGSRVLLFSSDSVN